MKTTLRTATVFLCLLLTGTTVWAEDKVPTSQSKQAARKPIPDDAAQKEAEKLIKDVFKKEYSDKSVEAQKAFARKLLQQGIETNDDVAAKFVLFREARDIAVGIGDIEVIIKAIDRMASEYDVDSLSMTKEGLDKGSRNIKDEASAAAFAKAYLEVANELLMKDNYRTAAGAAAGAVTCAKNAKDVSLTKEAQDKAQEIATIERQWSSARKALETLKENPDDAAANLAAGKFMCLVKGDWGKGLPLLVKGSDEGLKETASKDLADPKGTAEQVAIADSWGGLAEKEQGLSKMSLEDRATYWYEKALPSLSGLAKARIEKRLQELQRSRESAVDRGTANKYRTGGAATQKPGEGTKVTEPCAKIRMFNLKPVILNQTEGTSGWKQVPKELRGAAIFSEGVSGGVIADSGGVAAFEVLESGFACVACDYSYQGNPGGGWVEERWTEDDFVKNGWRKVADLTANDSKVWGVFAKQLRKGERIRLRCNKYFPPYVILRDPVAAGLDKNVEPGSSAVALPDASKKQQADELQNRKKTLVGKYQASSTAMVELLSQGQAVLAKGEKYTVKGSWDYIDGKVMLIWSNGHSDIWNVTEEKTWQCTEEHNGKTATYTVTKPGTAETK